MNYKDFTGEEISIHAKGWECPKCGAVYSPSTAQCFNCTGVTANINTTNNTAHGFDPDYIPSVYEKNEADEQVKQALEGTKGEK